jgi:hypothetical protein
MAGVGASPPAAPRVLLSGSPLGHLSTLFKRVAAVSLQDWMPLSFIVICYVTEF